MPQFNWRERMSRLVILLVVILVGGCGAPNGTNFDQDLFRDEDGLVRVKQDGSLFSGQTYQLICDECAEPLLLHWPVHFVGEYTDGIPDGTFWVPISGSQDSFFEYRDRKAQKKVIYENGKITDSDA